MALLVCGATLAIVPTGSMSVRDYTRSEPTSPRLLKPGMLAVAGLSICVAKGFPQGSELGSAELESGLALQRKGEWATHSALVTNPR